MKNVVRSLSQDARQLHPNLWNAARRWWDEFGDFPLYRKTKEPDG